MAAGIGKRLQPLTFKTPKPLIKVHGVSMINTAIEALHKNGIAEIHIVVGHLKEQFNALMTEYEGIDLIENPYYDTCNNISSLYVAREYLGDCIILDGDQVITNSEILDPCFERSGYNAVWTDVPTKEWLLTVEDGIVRSCSTNGGSGGWQLYSISRWSKEDGIKLQKHIEIEFEVKKNRQIYWDNVALLCYPQEYTLGIKEMKREDVTEIDGLDELIAYDESYKDMLEGA